MDYPSNSQRTIKEPAKKQDPKKVEKVIEGEVVRRKKPLGKRFKETFTGGDAGSVWEYVMLDVLVPAAKDMFADAVSQGVERMIFGEVRSTSRRPRSTGSNGYVAYNRYAPNSRKDDDRRPVSRRARASHDFDEIILATRYEAEEVVDRLVDIVDRYEVATVKDLYELVGASSAYTDDKWGWTDMRSAGVTRVRNGYLLDLPRPEPID